MLRSFAFCGGSGRRDQALRLPSTMGKLSDLTQLEIDDFNVSGSFPDSIFSLPSLASAIFASIENDRCHMAKV